jgi:CheY-like chemotaxis protein/HPt (histidine-containing phosphotransfer) domain-containing protein
MTTRKAGPILVVDDNEVNRFLLVRQLERIGYQAAAVGGGHEAVQAVAAASYALVFMDYRMPEMDGLEATRRIRHEESANAQRIPIVALTANAMEEDRVACLEAGMDEHISKPVTLETLRSVLRRFVPSGRAAAEGAPSDDDEDPIPHELVRIYLDELPDRVRAIRVAIRTGDADALTLAAHTLRSTSVLVGATPLAELCAEHEAAGRENRVDRVTGRLASLDDESERARRILRESLGTEARAYPRPSRKPTPRTVRM